jgi:phosphatidylserine decarboxylase
MKPPFILLQQLLPQHLFSSLIGFFAVCRWSLIKAPVIRVFSWICGVNMQEAGRADHSAYESFNDFFTRELNLKVRPICTAPDAIISPVDGCISELGNLRNNCLLQAKGMDYSLGHLLGQSRRLCDCFSNSSFATIYLAPKDYHRVHAPLESTLVESFYIPGKLYSVNNTTVQHIPGLFTRNERLVTVFDSPAGKLAMIMVGAMIVRGIRTTWHQDIYPPGQVTRDDLEVWPEFGKGEEVARFELGSTVILLFEQGRAIWDPTLQPNTTVKLGQRLASVRSPDAENVHGEDVP